MSPLRPDSIRTQPSGFVLRLTGVQCPESGPLRARYGGARHYEQTDSSSYQKVYRAVTHRLLYYRPYTRVKPLTRGVLQVFSVAPLPRDIVRMELQSKLARRVAGSNLILREAHSTQNLLA